MGNGSNVKTSQERELQAKRDWLTLTASEPSKRHVRRTQTIGKRLECENVPQIKLEERRCAVDVDRQSRIQHHAVGKQVFS